MDNNKQQDKPKPLTGFPVPLLRQSDGKPSASFTMVFLGFNVVLFWLFLSIFKGFGPIEVRAFDAGQAMTFLTPLLGLYFGRKFTDQQKELASSTKQTQQQSTPEKTNDKQEGDEQA